MLTAYKLDAVPRGTRREDIVGIAPDGAAVVWSPDVTDTPATGAVWDAKRGEYVARTEADNVVFLDAVRGG